MLHIRVVKIKEKYRSVQVFRYEQGSRVIIKHIGSAKTDDELNSLLEVAKVFIVDFTK